MNFLMNKLPQIRPVLSVEAGNVVSVDVGEVCRHGGCTDFCSRFLPHSRATQSFCNRDKDALQFGHLPGAWKWVESGLWRNGPWEVSFPGPTGDRKYAQGDPDGFSADSRRIQPKRQAGSLSYNVPGVFFAS